jgi:class 3 adenylate cyclase/tetratricopeptide (TPR) repeat protein
MTFEEILQQTVDILQSRGRVSYRALQRQFELDDAYLEDLKAELLYAYPQVVDEESRGLVWTVKKGAESTVLAASSSATGHTPVREPHAYTPPHLVERILTSHAALEGERKQVTVLFCDLANSTGLAEQLGPETMHTVLNAFFTHALDAVHRYEGTINQFLGDGFMALFGAPLAHEDHARRAVLAALELRRQLQAYNAAQAQQYGVELTIRIGLNTGLVVVGAIGDNLRMDYTAVGDTTNVAARLEHEAAPDQIVISEATYRLVAGYCTTRALGAFSLRGKAAPVRVWEVTDAQAARSRLEVAAERGLTPFVGREHELQMLHDCFAQAQAGHGQVVFLVGEAGLGKSRLLLEFHRRLAGESCTWLRGRCLSYGHGIAYHSIIDLLHQYFQVDEEDDDSTIIAKIEQGMTVLGEDLQPAIPHVRSLLSLPPGDDAVLSMDAQQRRFKLFEALRALILRWGETRPLVLVVEDLHWSDPTTEETLRYLADSVATARVVLLMTYRPGYHHPFDERTYVGRLVLHALSRHESAQLVEGMLATSALPMELRDWIMQKAEGNPFFIEEVLTSLLETGALAQKDGRYLLRTPFPEIDVPDTIQGVIMARIDRLADSPRRALQFASVVGREFTVRLLARIADAEAPLAPALQALKALEFIYERSIYPELAYMFKHALTHEVAYNSLLMQRRKVLHQMVAMAIEELYAERLAEFYEMLAYHYEQGEMGEKALAYLVQAGQKAQQAYANQEALGYYDRALAVSAQLAAVAPSTLMTLYAGKGAAHFLLSAFEPAIEAYRHMREVAQQVGDRTQEAAALYQLGMCCLWAHDFEQTLDYAAQARAIAETIDAKDSLAGSIWVSGKIPMVTGDLDTARSSVETSLRLSREAGDKTLEGISLWDLGLLCNWQGEYEQALQLQEQAITLGQAHHLGLVLIWAIWMKGPVAAKAPTMRRWCRSWRPRN